MANLKVLDGDAAAKYLSTDGAGTDADPHISHHVIDELPVGAAATVASTPVTIASDDALITAINAVSGATSGVAVVTDAAGTIQQYLRGLVKLIAAKIGITVADGDDTAQGATTDAAASSSVAEDATGRTGTGLLKGIKNILILMNAKFAALGQAAMAASMPVVIASDQTNVPVGLITNAVYNGTTALTPKFAIIDHAVTPNNTLVAAVADKKIRVLGIIMVVAGDVDVRFESGAGGTALTGVMSLAADGNGFVLPFSPVGWFETGVNTLLNLELSGAVGASGALVYIEV